MGLLRYLKKINPDLIAILVSLSVFLYGYLISLFFRAAINDEILYLRETLLISELFKQHEWIGAYGVGVHGFIFKIPVALLYVVFGPSVTMATVFNVTLASVTCFLFYYLLKRFFLSSWQALLGCLMLAASQRFLLVTPTYLREIPFLLVLIILIYSICAKWNKWIIGLLFVLLLDAKEYVFFPFFLSYVLWVLASELSIKDTLKNKISHIFHNLIRVTLPSILFLFMMFFTIIVPLNAYTSFILGLSSTKNFLNYSIQHLIRESELSVRQVPNRTSDLSNSAPKAPFNELTNVFRNLMIALVSPNVFGLMSIPLVICVPSIFYSVWSVKKNLKSSIGLLAIYHLIFTIFYLSQFSQNRYLFPVYVTAFIFFLSFIFSAYNTKRYVPPILLIIILTVCQLFFAQSFLLLRFVMQVVLIVLLVSIIFTKDDLHKNILRICCVFGFVVVSIAIASAYLITGGKNTNGQIFLARNYGVNMEYKAIAASFDSEDILLITESLGGELIDFYRKDAYINPEWYWSLREFIPKKKMLKTLGTQTTFYCNDCKNETIKYLVDNYKINKFVNIELNVADNVQKESFSNDYLLGPRIYSTQNHKRNFSFAVYDVLN